MRSRLDVPDYLLRRVKATAAMRGMKLKGFVASYLAEWVADSKATAGNRTDLYLAAFARGHKMR
ncbi:MAG: hypothetical protein ACYC96_06470 [Fimbriimonadaceae bacterium]